MPPRPLEHLSEYDALPVRRSPRLSSRYSRGDAIGSVPFPLSTLSYSATSRQTLSGFKEYDDPSTSILNESGQSVPAAFDEDFQGGGSDMPEHLYGMTNACRNHSSSHDACGQAPNHVTGSIGGSIPMASLLRSLSM